VNQNLSDRELRSALQYDPDALRRNIEKAKSEIELFEEAIRDQKTLIEQYEYYILLQRMQKASIK